MVCLSAVMAARRGAAGHGPRRRWRPRRGPRRRPGRPAAAARGSSSARCGEHENPDHPVPRHPAEHRELQDRPPGEEQGRPAEDDGDPRRPDVPGRCLMTSSPSAEIATRSATTTGWVYTAETPTGLGTSPASDPQVLAAAWLPGSSQLVLFCLPIPVLKRWYPPSALESTALRPQGAMHPTGSG